jgi:hypothetical protein
MAKNNGASRDPKLAARIMRLARQGKSCREIAKLVGTSRTTVSRIAKEKGWKWGSVNTERANEARAAYDAERRTTQILAMSVELDGLIGRYSSPHIAFSFGGKDNTYAEHHFEKPDSRTVLDISRAAYSLVSTMKILHNFDAADSGDLGAVDDYLAKAKGGS